MARKSKSSKNTILGMKLKDETKHGVLVVIFFLLALFSILSVFGAAGLAGNLFYKSFTYLFGIGYFLLPILFIVLGISFIKLVQPRFAPSQTLGSIFFLLSTLGIIDVASLNHGSGVIGRIAAYPFVKLFGTYASILFLGAILIISILVLFDKRPRLIPLWAKIVQFFKERLLSRNRREALRETDAKEEAYEEDLPAQAGEYEEEEDEKETPAPEEVGVPTESVGDEEKFEVTTQSLKLKTEYIPPSLSLLERNKGKPNVGDIKANSNIIKRTLANFGIEVEMDEITIGPTITRYALKPAEGVKLSRIVGLQNDLALSLAAHPIRIEAPIPGKSLVGIEIPNKTKSTVGLATLLSDESFQKASNPLVIALGRRLSGKSLFANLAKMPHLLIGGATGSGKSVTIHSIITSLLYRNGPEDLRFIMIDPKRVELTLYNNIPHLLTPVVTGAKETILALRWAAVEMEKRYDVLESEAVRDIESYNNKIQNEKGKKEEKLEHMPYIVIIIDELADIMSTYPRELEAAIVRLAQMSRAVGIHLVLSTQRPSVNVITGLIKANIPARIALQVSSLVDSRTILDMAGAEKLIGAGDMLYMSGEMSKPERIQSAFISEKEVKGVVAYLTESYQDELFGNEINLTNPATSDKSIFESRLDDGEGDDELYEEAREIIISARKASTSYLQRKLKIGYARAARIIDMLEERGIVGPQDGSKPREVFEDPVDNVYEDEGDNEKEEE